MIYKGDKWSLKEEMTCGAPQRSRVGPLVWNVMYDDFLCMDLPAGTSIIGFADDALVVCAADDVRILELRINESVWQAKRWLDSRCLKMAPEKTSRVVGSIKVAYDSSVIRLLGTSTRGHTPTRITD